MNLAVSVQCFNRVRDSDDGMRLHIYGDLHRSGAQYFLSPTLCKSITVIYTGGPVQSPYIMMAVITSDSLQPGATVRGVHTDLGQLIIRPHWANQGGHLLVEY